LPLRAAHSTASYYVYLTWKSSNGEVAANEVPCAQGRADSSHPDSREKRVLHSCHKQQKIARTISRLPIAALAITMLYGVVTFSKAIEISGRSNHFPGGTILWSAFDMRHNFVVNYKFNFPSIVFV
jgi:hypothetical protein